MRKILSYLYLYFSPFISRALNNIFLNNGNALRRLRLVKQKIETLLQPNLKREKSHSLLCNPPNTKEFSNMLGVNVAGYVTGTSGIGSSIRALIHALEANGILYVVNNIATFRQKSKDTPVLKDNFTEDNPYSTNIVVVNADESHSFFLKRGSNYSANKYNIGYWVWELSRFPEKWADRLKYFNEIWVPSSFAQESISKVSHLPVIKIPHCISLDETSIGCDTQRLNINNSFNFLFTFDFNSFFNRKNPLGLIKAYKIAFGNRQDVQLILKCINANYKQEMSLIESNIKGANIRLIEGNMQKNDYYSLVSACDCYISLHRSEGFGLTLAEAMYLKKPVIATSYSGNMDFMNINNSFLVKYDMVEVGPNEYPPFGKGYVWADPDLEHGAELMTYVFKNREHARMIGEKASSDIKNLLSPKVVGQQVMQRLKLITESK